MRIEPLRAVCYEDRPQAMDSLILMGESLCRADARATLHLTVPDAPAFVREWARRWPQVTLTEERPEGVAGWNIKPSLLLRELDAGAEEALWLDDDIIVTRSLTEVLDEFPRDALLLAEEWTRAVVPACHVWNLKPGRVVPVVNNCVVRVTAAHRPLLQRWSEMLADARYREAQKLPFAERPNELLHDGWPLIALLESEEFSHVRYDVLNRRRHIAQCAGSSAYRPGDRILDLFRGLPALIHGLGRKPWETETETRALRRYLLDVATDVSPYVLAARRVAGGAGREPQWLAPRTRTGRALRWLTNGNPALCGLPLAIPHVLTRN